VAEVSIVGLDLAKNVFQVHGACADGSVAFRRKLPRAKVLSFFAAQPPCRVAMEACASSHHWAREISALGHEVKLIAPAYVKPFAGTKEAQMIEMLKRPEGATVEQIAAATGWQHHTIRGAISGALKKKLGLIIEATRTREVGPNKTGAKGSSTVYRITGSSPATEPA
jgi:transposase